MNTITHASQIKEANKLILSLRKSFQIGTSGFVRCCICGDVALDAEPHTDSEGFLVGGGMCVSCTDLGCE